MRSKHWILGLLFVLLPTVGSAQENSARKVVLQLADGGFIAFKSETAWAAATGPAPAAQVMQGEFTTQAFVDDNQVIHRLLVDSAKKYIFGYDIVIAAAPASKKFNITVNRLDPRVESELLTRSQQAQPARIATLPQSTDAQVLDDGDSFALDLLVNQKAGVKIVDLVKVSFDQAKLWEEAPGVVPRDFTPDAVALTVSDFRLLVDGNLMAKGKPGASFSGGLLWCYVEGQGRFIFSLVARTGYEFQKVGVIKENRIEFVAGGKHYEWLSSAPVIPGGGTWHLWVLRDPKYLPFGNQEVSKQDKTKLDKLDDSIKAAQDKAAKIADPTPTAYRKQPGDGNSEPGNPRRFKVMVGAADRIENLLPK
ncbi:MAG TPA: hypothetical protein VLL54_22175 [Pyrinomonadaceae bacterium]|nr:hypothetical protein [Pyrinomonadaceae bacterium]